MNRIIMMICIIFMLLPCLLQAGEYAMDKGSISTGGSISYSTYMGTAYWDHHELVITPYLNYFIRKNLAMGIRLNIIYSTDVYEGNTLAGAGVGMTYYLTTKMQAVYPFLGFDFLYSTEDINNRAIQIYSAQPYLGLAFMLAETVSLDFKAQYSMDRVKVIPVYDSFQNGGIFSIRFGISAYIF